jgi:hypothetical protein
MLSFGRVSKILTRARLSPVKAGMQHTGRKAQAPPAPQTIDANRPGHLLFPTLILAWLLCSGALLWKLDSFTRGGAWQ